jgi:hypothetical protein
VSCRRAYEIDIAAYLADPRAAAHADFRAHYPACAPCSAEVRAWTELAARLGAGRAAHPEPALLLRYEDAPDRFDPAARAELRMHLAGCASCRDELAGLRTFQPALAAAPQPAARPARRRRGVAAALRGLVWQPAFAYAVAFAIAGPLLYLQVTRDRLDLRGAPRAEPPVAPQVAPSLAPERAPEPVVIQPAPVPASPQAAPSAEPPRAGRGAEGIAPGPAPSVRGSEPAAKEGTARFRLRAREEPAAVDPVPTQERAAPARPAAEEERALRETKSEKSLERPEELRLEQLRSLGYVAPRSDAASGAAPAARTPSLRATDGGGYALTIPLDPDGGATEVTIESAERDRKLVERFTAGASTAELRFPADWPPGRYRVLVRNDRGERESFVER